MTNTMTKKIKTQKGYIALVSMLVVASVALTISIAVSLRGMEDLQMSFASSQAAKSASLADSCMEEGLNRLRQNWQDYIGISLSIGDNSCIINVNESGTFASLEAYGNVDIFQQKAYAEVDNNLEVILWQNY